MKDVKAYIEYKNNIILPLLQWFDIDYYLTNKYIEECWGMDISQIRSPNNKYKYWIN